MARLTFRQGIIRHGKSPRQIFFLQQNGNSVDLVISPDLTIIAFADGNKDYMYTESVTLLQPWGPFATSIDYWLYWNVDKVSGIRTFGHTILMPVNSSIAPPIPQAGQMWFDTSIGNNSSGKMHEWSGASWVPVLRLFACRYNSGQFFSPVDGSISQSSFTGSQVGPTGNVTKNIGALAFDLSGKPIINQDGKFFTTEDVFTTGVPTGASLKVNNILLRAQAITNLAAFQVVVFDNYNRMSSAAPFDFIDKVYGIVEENVVINDIGNVIMEGIIYNDQWDFSDTINNPNMSGVINDPIFLTSTGELTTNINNSIPGQVPVGAIVALQSIIFRPGLYGANGFGPGKDHGNLTGLADDDHPQYFNLARGDVQYYSKPSADLVFAPIIHTHVRSDITDFAHLHLEADISNLDKYTQAETDNLLADRVALAGSIMSGTLILSGNPVNALDAVTKQYADSIAAGLDAKESVVVATTTDLLGIYNSLGGTGGTGEFTNIDVSNLDGIEGIDYILANNSRVLVKDQIDAKQNGIYIVTVLGSPPVNATMERSPDHDGTPAAEVSPSNFVFTTNGLSQAGSGWLILPGTATGPNDTIILNTDDINWSAISSSTTYTGDGTTINIDNGTDIINVIPASAGGTVDAALWNGAASNISATPTLNEVLIYDGVSWINSILYSMGVVGSGSIDINQLNNNIDIVTVGGTLALSTDNTASIEANVITLTSPTGNIILSSGSNILTFNAGSISTTLQTDTFDISPVSGGVNANITLRNSFNDTTTISVNASNFGATLFTLPSTNGNLSEVLLTDGTGITSWGTIPASGVSNTPAV